MLLTHCDTDLCVLCGAADRRVDGWPLLESPIPTVLLTLGYLLLVWLGPQLMRHRRPLQLRAPLVLYNLTVSLLNLYIGVEVSGASGWMFLMGQVHRFRLGIL